MNGGEITILYIFDLGYLIEIKWVQEREEEEDYTMSQSNAIAEENIEAES